MWIIAYKSTQDDEVLLNSIRQEIVIIVNKATTSLDRKHYLCFTWGKQSFSFFQIEAVMSAYDFHMQSGELYCSFFKPMYIVHENSLRLFWCIHMIKIRKKHMMSLIYYTIFIQISSWWDNNKEARMRVKHKKKSVLSFIAVFVHYSHT